MSRRNCGGHRRLKATRLGAGATENIWPLVRRLEDSHRSRLTGAVVRAFNRTVYISVPPSRASDRPALVVLGTDSVRDGPLLVTLDTPVGLGFDDQHPNEDVQFRLSADRSTLYVDLNGGVTATVPLSMVATLPAPGGVRNRINIDQFQPGTETLARQYALLTWLLEDGVADGLGLLAALDRRAAGEEVERIDRLLTSFRTTLCGNQRLVDQKSIPEPLVDLIGLGPGATPSGDDILVGALLVLRCISDPVMSTRVRRLCDRLTSAAIGETTRPSAALLEQAARGRAAAPAIECVHGLTASGKHGECTHATVRRLLGTGHTSGADSLAGMLLVTTVVLPELATQEDGGGQRT